MDSGLPAEDLTDLVYRSDSEGVFLDEKFVALVPKIRKSCPKVRKIWLLSGEADEGTETVDELKAAGQGYDEPEPPAEDDISMIVYTSGTTGKSKGVMLTQSNLYSNIEAVLYDEGPGLIFLSVLPVHHCFCLVMDWLNGFWMGSVICINDNLMHMIRNIGIFQPDVMLMVPLMLETIYKRLKSLGTDVPPTALAQKVFGPKLKRIFTGGAHLDPYYIDEFEKYGISIYEGYGMSECSPVITNNREGNSKKGSIGKPLSNVEVKFENGEILVRGTSVMRGYYKMEQETAETLRDGWLHTGDIGYLQDGKYLKITDRKKEIFKLSSGKYIAPQVLETLLRESEFIDNAFVFGANEKFASAIILPAYAKLKAYAEEQGIVVEKKEQLLENEKIMGLLNREVAAVNKKIADHENIKKPHFVFDEWSPDNGMLSQTLKPKRRNLNKRYAEVIASTYKTPA